MPVGPEPFDETRWRELRVPGGAGKLAVTMVASGTSGSPRHHSCGATGWRTSTAPTSGGATSVIEESAVNTARALCVVDAEWSQERGSRSGWRMIVARCSS